MRWPRQTETDEPRPHQATEHPWFPLANDFPPTDLASEAGSWGWRRAGSHHAAPPAGEDFPSHREPGVSPAGWHKVAKSSGGEFFRENRFSIAVFGRPSCRIEIS